MRKWSVVCCWDDSMMIGSRRSAAPNDLGAPGAVEVGTELDNRERSR